jgi:hypothetical protein
VFSGSSQALAASVGRDQSLFGKAPVSLCDVLFCQHRVSIRFFDGTELLPGHSK